MRSHFRQIKTLLKMRFEFIAMLGNIFFDPCVSSRLIDWFDVVVVVVGCGGGSDGGGLG